MAARGTNNAVSSAMAQSLASAQRECLTKRRRRSATVANSKGDRGHPCRIPTKAWKEYLSLIHI
eukprot:9558938-Prorocentrum_lima.AAC.1